MKYILILMTMLLVGCQSNKPQVKNNANQVNYQWGFQNSPIGQIFEYYRNKENDIPFVSAKILMEDNDGND